MDWASVVNDLALQNLTYLRCRWTRRRPVLMISMLKTQIPAWEIAAMFGVDKDEVDSAVHTLVLVSGLVHNSKDPEQANRIELPASSHDAVRGQ